MHISVARLAGRWNVSRGPLGSPPTFYEDVCAGPTGLQTVFLRRAYGLWPLRTSQRWGHQSGRTDPRGPHQNKLGWPGPASLQIISMGSKPPLLWFEPRFYHLLKCVCGMSASRKLKQTDFFLFLLLSTTENPGHQIENKHKKTLEGGGKKVGSSLGNANPGSCAQCQGPSGMKGKSGQSQVKANENLSPQTFPKEWPEEVL